MKPLLEEIEYKNEEEFRKLTSAIQIEIDSGTLNKYIDKTWRNEVRDDWNGEYISITNRKMYRFYGAYYHTTKGEPKFYGNWTIIRDERGTENGIAYSSQYQIREHEPGVYSNLEFEIEHMKQGQTKIEFEWKDVQSDGKEHSRLIKSTIEYGIISAFEDLDPECGIYKVKILSARYHPIDSSFSLLSYAANRNLKRALFMEHEDKNPTIENRKFIKSFRSNLTIERLNNE